VQPHAHGRRRIAVQKGILEQSLDGPPDADAIPGTHAWPGRVQLDLALGAFACHQASSLAGPLDDLAQIELFAAQGQMIGGRSGGVQEGLQHLRHAVGLLDDGCQPNAGRVLVAARELALGHLGRGAHHRDRVAQVVRSHGHELFGLFSSGLARSH
jgi:hypothetical protein